MSARGSRSRLSQRQPPFGFCALPLSTIKYHHSVPFQIWRMKLPYTLLRQMGKENTAKILRAAQLLVEVQRIVKDLIGYFHQLKFTKNVGKHWEHGISPISIRLPLISTPYGWLATAPNCHLHYTFDWQIFCRGRADFHCWCESCTGKRPICQWENFKHCIGVAKIFVIRSMNWKSPWISSNAKTKPVDKMICISFDWLMPRAESNHMPRRQAFSTDDIHSA